MKLFDWLISVVWSGLTTVARVSQKLGLWPQKNLGLPVISVGNLQAGGAGKTPFVMHLAQYALSQGLNVAVLLRGYQKKREKEVGVIPPRKEEIQNLSIEDYGDEALLIHSFVPEAWVGVGRDRHASFQKILAQSRYPIDLVILDDGFQKLSIKKTWNFLLITEWDWGEVPFRDFPFWAREADGIFFLSRSGSSQGPPLMQKTGLAFQTLNYTLNQPVPHQPIWLLTSVADGEAIKKFLEHQGCRIDRHQKFKDHARIEKSWFLNWLEKAKAHQAVIGVTGKDWVKIASWVSSSDPVTIFEPQLNFLSD